MPDASGPIAAAPEIDAAFARLLADLPASARRAPEGLAAAGVRAWLRCLAADRLGTAWQRRHLGAGPRARDPLCSADPAAIQATYAHLLSLSARAGADGKVDLHARPFARQQAGAYYTPKSLATLLLDEAGVDGATRALVDPACGPGGLLCAAAARLPAERLYGIDADPLAVACARVTLALTVVAAGRPPPDLTGSLVCADALLDADAWARLTPPDGFDALVANPPWERAKLQQVEWLAARDPGFRGLDAGARKARLARLQAAGDPLWHAFAAERTRRGAYAARLRARFPEACGGDANLYAGFVALAAERIAPTGRAALLVPSGIAADQGTCRLVAGLAAAGRLTAFLDFENRGPGPDGRAGRGPAGRFFPGVDGRFRFACLGLTGASVRVAHSRLAFGLHKVAALDGGRPVTLSRRALAALNPASGGLAMPRSRADAALALRLHRRWPALVDRRGAVPRPAFPVRYRRMFDLTNDAHRFQPWDRADAGAWPLYEGKMVQAFDHRAASVARHAGNLKRPAQPRRTTDAERADPAFRPTPRFAVPADQVSWPPGLDWAIGLKHVTSPTNSRSVIAAAVPRCAAANSLPLLLPTDASPAGVDAYRRSAPLLLANLNARVLDWLARGKLQGQNLNLYILEQLPVIPPAAYTPADAAMVRRALKQLCHTSHDLDGFARDLGHAGPPVPWCRDSRHALLADLDRLYARLYRLTPAQWQRVATHFRPAG